MTPTLLDISVFQSGNGWCGTESDTAFLLEDIYKCLQMEIGKPHNFPTTWAHPEAWAQENPEIVFSTISHIKYMDIFWSERCKAEFFFLFILNFIYCSYLGKVFQGWKVNYLFCY